MKPSLGRTVIVRGYTSNGSDEHPAIVNRVWGNADPADGVPVAINVTMFPDCGSPKCMTSVPLFETREAALARGHGCAHVAFWPDRT